jgi:hypothetical protein
MQKITGKVESIQHYVIKFVSGFASPGYNWNIVESGVKHHKPNFPIIWLLTCGLKQKNIRL